MVELLILKLLLLLLMCSGLKFILHPILDFGVEFVPVVEEVKDILVVFFIVQMVTTVLAVVVVLGEVEVAVGRRHLAHIGHLQVAAAKEVPQLRERRRRGPRPPVARALSRA